VEKFLGKRPTQKEKSTLRRRGNKQFGLYERFTTKTGGEWKEKGIDDKRRTERDSNERRGKFPMRLKNGSKTWFRIVKTGGLKTGGKEGGKEKGRGKEKRMEGGGKGGSWWGSSRQECLRIRIPRHSKKHQGFEGKGSSQKGGGRNGGETVLMRENSKCWRDCTCKVRSASLMKPISIKSLRGCEARRS